MPDKRIRRTPAAARAEILQAAERRLAEVGPDGLRLQDIAADVGIGVRSVAAICGLDFVPLQRERYDLVIPKAHYETLTGLKVLLDTIVSRPFREELEALGGYDTRDTGRFVEAVKG